MNIKEVKDLIREILLSDISEFELEHTGTRIRLRRGPVSSDSALVSVPHAVVSQVTPSHEIPAATAGSFISSAAAGETAASEEGLHIITSPIVGTFYRSPSPEGEPYVKISSRVETGSTLCIVEAMKLMNEIPSDVSGEVVEIYVDNGQPVEYGQKLFGIRPRK
jgi:acetyl-CoA carboxylase biotin carboxyl carrier protein